ncbi:hypothetical protein B7494_g5271 [Chlorociboria aeruginascens]|nr:hypothetical protein B7494_g5271 [Chlorociboria aeruginascens]
MHNSHGSLQNGFVDPRILLSQFPDSGPEETESTHSSSSASEYNAILPVPAVRRLPPPTGYCYDDRMRLHVSADYVGNHHHPEDPRRVEVIMRAFKDAGLVFKGPWNQLESVLKINPNRYMSRIPAREATREEICTMHTPAHFAWVKELQNLEPEVLRNLSLSLDSGRRSLYVGALTYEAALISAGGAIETCKNVVVGNCRNAIAIIRPPGHHAEHHESMGFCIFNNVPIAARVCMMDYPEQCRKILILDWDVHHGNGIQNMFYEDPNVLYISLHVYQNGNFYPGQPETDGSPDGNINRCGAGIGIGRNVNIGWHDQGMGDGEYMAAFQRVVMPIAREFDPDLVIVSAGFDAAAGDELGGCFVTPACYSHMTHMLMSLANGKVAVCLEGGYNLGAISRSALAVAKTLMGDPPMRMTIPPLNKAAHDVLFQIQQHQAPYWECMRVDIPPVKEILERGGMRLSDAIRSHQRRILSSEFGMIPLTIMRDTISTSFNDQVLITPNFISAKKILIIIHDPPEFYVTPNPNTNEVELHNAFISDSLHPYIEWASENYYQIFDINIPKHISSSTETTPFKPSMTEMEQQTQMKELLCYLWDNYLELAPCNNIAFMGVGDAYLGIKQLLLSRNCRSRISCILSFVTGALRPVRSETDHGLSSWYKERTKIYVPPTHSCWNDEESARKVRKNRFGTVVESRVKGLGDMLSVYMEEGVTWIEQRVESVRDRDETEEEV